MKKFIVAIILVLTLVGCGYRYDDTSLDVQMKVLSVNQNILRGKMVGEFLSSASGTVANDVNIVGVSFTLGDSLFLEDLKIKHSMLAYYAGKNTLPGELQFDKWRGNYRMQVRINGYVARNNYFSKDGINKILDRELDNE